MKISDLREFIRLSETLHYTTTAREFYITQPVLSKHIVNMENELDTKLFIRASSGVELTKIGNIFLKHASRIVREYDIARDHIELAKAGLEKFFVLGYLYGAARSLLIPALNRFSKRYPDIFVSLKALEFDEVIPEITNSTIDVALTTLFNIDESFLKESYCIIPLYEDSLSIFLPEDHPLAKRDQISIYDLKGEKITITAAPFMTNDSNVMKSYLSPIWDQLEIRYGLLDVLSMRMLMKNHNSLYFTFNHLKNILDDDIVAIPLKETSHIKFPVSILYPKSEDCESLRAFAQCFKDEAQLQIKKKTIYANSSFSKT
ncbi:LysR family transcriptional regulator [Adlercreutzia sp. ZJ154]|uniref:LysR family transcriptional regulator n=1 Tax=Adlercreutzia sp. ZJ154 TaxID=2709790 RepID=UPI0013EABD0D|nr:LysR family transcriptional regulator [Adlercreutzia sp. ZJ154]